jgi:hypothetical protein
MDKQLRFKDFIKENLDEAKSVGDLGVKELNGYKLNTEVAVFGRDKKTIVAIGTIVRFQSNNNNKQPVIKLVKGSKSSQGELVADFKEITRSAVFS